MSLCEGASCPHTWHERSERRHLLMSGLAPSESPSAGISSNRRLCVNVGLSGAFKMPPKLLRSFSLASWTDFTRCLPNWWLYWTFNSLQTASECLCLPETHHRNRWLSSRKRISSKLRSQHFSMTIFFQEQKLEILVPTLDEHRCATSQDCS